MTTEADSPTPGYDQALEISARNYMYFLATGLNPMSNGLGLSDQGALIAYAAGRGWIEIDEVSGLRTTGHFPCMGVPVPETLPVSRKLN